MKNKKGSKFWMQEIVRNNELKTRIDKALGTMLEWINPNKNDMGEHELRTRNELFGLSKQEMDVLFSFWPDGQPKWDGIAIDSEKTLYIFEAKANKQEIINQCQASVESAIVIENKLRKIHDEYYPEGDFSVWMKKHYQLANRLAFLKEIKNNDIPEIKDVKLVLLSFANDFTHHSTSTEEMEEVIKNEWKIVTGSENFPTEVKHIVVDVKDIKIS